LLLAKRRWFRTQRGNCLTSTVFPDFCKSLHAQKRNIPVVRKQMGETGTFYIAKVKRNFFNTGRNHSLEDPVRYRTWQDKECLGQKYWMLVTLIQNS
jgi:hypothetical protein